MLSVGDLGVRTGFDNSFTSEKKKLSYPYLYVLRLREEIVLVVTCLEPGPLPIVLSDSGVPKQVGSCAVSALELARPLRVYQFEVVLSEIDRHTMREISDVLEVLLWTVPSSSS